MATWIFVCLATVAYHGLRYLMSIVDGNLSSRINFNNNSSSSSNNNSQHDTDHLSNMELGEEESFLKTGKFHSSSSSSSAPTPHTPLLKLYETRQLLCLRVVHAALAGASYCLALLLMLVAMTYNSSLFMALIVGYAIGDFVFLARTKALHASQGKHNDWLTGRKYSGDCH